LRTIRICRDRWETSTFRKRLSGHGFLFLGNSSQCKTNQQPKSERRPLRVAVKTDALGLANIVTLDKATIEAFPSGVNKIQIIPKGSK
jgi:hypothetical protein